MEWLGLRDTMEKLDINTTHVVFALQNAGFLQVTYDNSSYPYFLKSDVEVLEGLEPGALIGFMGGKAMKEEFDKYQQRKKHQTE